jgi:hypothetical protein
VNWRIPGPQGWAPDGTAVEIPRLRDDVNDRPIDGCLDYGGLGASTTAEFLGTAAEETANVTDKCGGKASTPAAIEPGSLPKDGWKDKVHIFFPSDIKNPRDTMLEVIGDIGINSKDDGYQSYFSYIAKRLDGRPDGDVRAIKIVPFFPNSEKEIISAYYEENKTPTILGDKGYIQFYVSGQQPRSQWTVVPDQALYQFLDKQGAVAAAVPIPLFREVIRKP